MTRLTGMRPADDLSWKVLYYGKKYRKIVIAEINDCSIWIKESQIHDAVSFQPVNTGQGAHLPLETNEPDSMFDFVGLATPPPQRVCYLPSLAGTRG